MINSKESPSAELQSADPNANAKAQFDALRNNFGQKRGDIRDPSDYLMDLRKWCIGMIAPKYSDTHLIIDQADALFNYICTGKK